MDKTKILVLVDFSEYTKKILQVAKRWADSAGLTIQVFHELDFIVPTLVNNDLRLKMKYGQIHEINRTWFGLKKLIFDEEDQVSFQIIEEPVIGFLEKENLLDSSLILMGLKGGGVFKKIFIGSKVSEIIEKTNNITAAFPKTIQDFEPKKIIVIVHPKFDFNLQALENLVDCLPKTVSTIQWISIAQAKDNVEDLNDYLDAISKKFITGLKVEMSVFSGEDLFLEVKSLITNNNKQILVIQKGSRNFKDKFFRKFLVNELVFDGSVPLIVLPT